MAKGEEGSHSDWTLPRSHKTTSHKIDRLALVSTIKYRLPEKKMTILKYGLHPKHAYDVIIRHAGP